MPKKLPKQSKKKTTVKIPKKPILTSNVQARVQAYNKRGITLAMQKKWSEAADAFQQALALDPNSAKIHNNLGNVLSEQSQFAEAVGYYQRAVALKPDFTEAHNNLGNALREQGRFSEAKVCYQHALDLKPDFAEAHNGLGNILTKQGQFSEAIDCYQRALALKPNFTEVHNNLGKIFIKQDQFSEASNCFQQVLALNPNDAEAHYNLGKMLKKQAKLLDAIVSFQRAIAYKPDFAKAYFKLGMIYQRQGKLAVAFDCYKHLITLEPNNVKGYNIIGMTLQDKGMIHKAIEYYRRALEIQPTEPRVHSNLLLGLHYAENLEQATIFAEHQRFNEQHAKPLATSLKPHLNESTPTRQLRIGYVSGDFREHPVAYFIESVLAHHNHQQFKIFGYYNNDKHDDFTKRLQQYADHWMNCLGRSNKELAEKIRQDQIDILVDLSGHTAKNRLLVFVQKPAPVQVTYLGYPNTTGLATIDYRITDNYRDPEGTTDSFSSETLLRMPDTYFCYRPHNDSPLVNELPARQNGYITFGSFNNFAKLNPNMIALWAQILATIKHSKYLIKTKSLHDNKLQQSLIEQFVRLGVNPEQLILEGSTSVPTHLNHYHQVDIGLDSFPYNGGTTTCEALWMGVPVVTLVGKTHVSRMGLSILSTLGLTELVAHTPEEYVDICINLANDIAHLQNLRTGMRERMQNSPLMDGATFTRHLETTYRKMWEKWCAQIS